MPPLSLVACKFRTVIRASCPRFQLCDVPGCLTFKPVSVLPLLAWVLGGPFTPAPLITDRARPCEASQQSVLSDFMAALLRPLSLVSWLAACLALSHSRAGSKGGSTLRTSVAKLFHCSNRCLPWAAGGSVSRWLLGFRLWLLPKGLVECPALCLLRPLYVTQSCIDVWAQWLLLLCRNQPFGLGNYCRW